MRTGGLMMACWLTRDDFKYGCLQLICFLIRPQPPFFMSVNSKKVVGERAVDLGCWCCGGCRQSSDQK